MNYIPLSAGQFIGPARQIALQLERLAVKLKAKPEPTRILLLGNPGTGKTSLANFFCRAMQIGKWSSHNFNGTQMKVDAAEDVARAFRFSDLLSEFRALRIEEVDAVPTLAQTRLLTLLDDMTDQSIVLCTSNCGLKQLEPRFQSRFMVFEVDAPNKIEIAELLETLGVEAQEADNIAGFCMGDVRQALNDAARALLHHECALV